MLGVEDYGSGSDNDSDSETPILPPPKKSTFSLPPPTAGSISKAAAPKKKKITIGLPALKPAGDEDDLTNDRPAKKPRLEGGAGASSLVSMLPAPKQKNPVLPAPERVLGGGGGRGLVFNTSRSTPALPSHVESSVAEAMDTEMETPTDTPTASSTSSSTAFSFRPTSLAKGRSNISVEERNPPKPRASALGPSMDFFSLGTSSPKSNPSGSSSSQSSLPAFSSAPVIPTFEPPEPTPTDAYPGYYQLPSGKWAAHDAAYYNTFATKWQREYNAQVRALEKGAAKGFEGMDQAEIEEVDALKEMERAKLEIREREDRKGVTQDAKGEPAVPKMKITAAKQSGVARSRHQLSTMLMEAYQNREALEDKIAEGRRNRKEAGNKYGF